MSADHISKINALIQRLKHFAYINGNIPASDLIEKSDLDLFKKISYPGHSLNHLLPPNRVSHNLRERGHTVYLISLILMTALRKNSY